MKTGEAVLLWTVNAIMPAEHRCEGRVGSGEFETVRLSDLEFEFEPINARAALAGRVVRICA
jgi:hypothetical protein